MYRKPKGWAMFSSRDQIEQASIVLFETYHNVIIRLIYVIILEIHVIIRAIGLVIREIDPFFET